MRPRISSSPIRDLRLWADGTAGGSQRGIDTFTGTYLADNRPVTALINEAGEPAIRVTSAGIAEFSVPLRS
jgi:hypothetical protein